MTKVV